MDSCSAARLILSRETALIAFMKYSRFKISLGYVIMPNESVNHGDILSTHRSEVSSGSQTPNKRLASWAESKNLAIDTDTIISREEARNRQKRGRFEYQRPSVQRVPVPKLAEESTNREDTHSSWTTPQTTQRGGCISNFFAFCKR